MAKKYDVIILGGGNAGFAVSKTVQAAGKTVAIVENRDFGGTCPNRGCTPKKVLVAAAQALHEIEKSDAHCIDVGKPSLNWSALIRREKSMIAGIPDGMENLARERGDVFVGSAQFAGPNIVTVNGERLEGSHIVIATGSTPRPLSIEGAEHMITSEDILSEEQQPSEVVFVGGGVIAMEFSHVYARAGSKVTILEAMPTLLPHMEEGAVAALRQESARLGISIKTNVDVKTITKNGNRQTVTYMIDQEEYTIETDQVVNGAGRVANVKHLNLEAANIKHDQHAIEVDDHLRSVSNPSIWVCGDALVGPAQLSPVASYEGQIVGTNIVEGPISKPDYAAIPSGVYTVPALSTVGLTEKAAKQKGLSVKVTESDMSNWFSGKTYAETVAYAKVIIDEDSDHIVGAHMVGHHGEELIHIFAMAMRHNISAGDLKQDIFAFPTFSSDIKNLI
ncbi:dihydrolipoyl dehydrogenase family protein [Sneathiella aquimaris]|uniref:dihydrolipoyl dehydrogenase family protein n=1 Tax=Sneathiella aquimaris TaxID=2599305 RepID=UPI00146B2D37|nr:NAD(P)/FAD-dependent oxidoreductase [Sneathiella aquimaris]